MPAEVRAATRMTSAVCPSSTQALVPSSNQPPSFSCAAISIADRSQRPLSSDHATVAVVSPEAMPGNTAACASAVAHWSRALVANTAVER